MLNDEKATILVVDDNKLNLFALEQVLSRPERNFLTANSGQEALKIALNNEVDLIILDVQMPDMNGFEVAQILKSNKRTKDIPIIFASAEKKENKVIPTEFEKETIDYLYKPLDPKMTEEKVTALLELHLQKKELTRKNAEREKHTSLINNSPDLICIIDARTLKVQEVNETVNRMLGYTIEEIKGASILSYISEEDYQRIERLLKENNEKISLEIPTFGKGKKIKRLDWNIVSKNGLWFANAREVTEPRKTDK
jgi:PAS domain S-box-containing protein